MSRNTSRLNNRSSVFKLYLTPEKFTDRFISDKKEAIDVIIPLVHTNELWEKNLMSIYREIPVNRLLVGDGGCIDNSIEIVKKFPRVSVFDHRKFISLGYSIRKLIEQVQTDWFVYLHSDIYLPIGWFNQMKRYQDKYDWYECRQHISVLIDYELDYPDKDRALSGSQMGRKDAFKNIIGAIEDDYIYRNEDMVFADLIKRNGLKYGRVSDAFHYHQIMNKVSIWKRQVKNISFDIHRELKEKRREWLMQSKGIIKYTNPDDIHLIRNVQNSLAELMIYKIISFDEFRKWVKNTNPLWLPYLNLSKKIVIKYRYKQALKTLIRKIRMLQSYAKKYTGRN